MASSYKYPEDYIAWFIKGNHLAIVTLKGETSGSTHSKYGQYKPIDEAVTKEEKPSFPTTPLPRLTEGGLKTLQYVYRNDPETLQNIYNKYALPEQYSGLKALV